MKKIVPFSFFTILSLFVFAQRYTISGYVSDQKTSEKLIGASVYDTISKRGTITNAYGFYSLTLPEGKAVLIFSYVGYSPILWEVDVNSTINKNVLLNPTIQLDEIVVVGQRENRQVETTQMSLAQIPVQTIKQLPVFFSETDILKTIQLLPGVQSGGEGTSGLYVRGGGPDQNLILLDGVPVYNCDHLFGFFSVFNADAINNITLIKGGFPARYGGRLSSVLDIRMKDGNLNEHHKNFSIGLISSKIMLEGPIKKQKSSYLVSARRTYIDVLAQPFMQTATNVGTSGYYFYDFNSKFNYIFSDTNRVYLSVYVGNDKAYSRYKDSYYDDTNKYEEKMKAGIGWGNIITVLRWNHLFTPKLFANLTTTFSRYRFNVGFQNKQTTNSQQTEEYSLKYFSGIHDFSAKIDFDYRPKPNHNILFGTSATYHTFSPGINVFKVNTIYGDKLDTTFGGKNIYATEVSSFVEDDISLNAMFKANVGIHHSLFFVRNEWYSNIEPRLSVRYLFHEKWSLKAAYSIMNQYIHLLTNSGIGLPTDLWLPVTDKIKPQHSVQYALGIYSSIISGFDMSIEGYYKTMQNIIEYKEGASFFMQGSSWEDKITMGNGWAYGSEFFIKKNKGKTTGWIGYTLSWSWRKFDDLNFGKKFPYRYDRRHDISIAATHQFSERFDIGIVWVYGTGNSISLPIEHYPAHEFLIGEHYYFDDMPSVQYYNGRNGFRMPAYHRLDLSFNMHKKRKYYLRTWTIGVYNAYNRKNPYYLYFKHDNNQKRLTQISLFPIIPSFSYSMNF